MAAFSQRVVTMPEGRNRLIQRSKDRQQLSLSLRVCVCACVCVCVCVCACTLSCMLNDVKVGSGGLKYLHVCFSAGVSSLTGFVSTSRLRPPLQVVVLGCRGDHQLAPRR